MKIFRILLAFMLGITMMSAFTSAANGVTTTKKIAVVYFTSDSSVVGPKSRATLTKLAPSLGKSSTVTLTGFATNSGTSAAGKSVARNRANAVRKYLISKGVKSTFAIAIGVPSRGSLTANARRVEISIGSSTPIANGKYLWSADFGGPAGQAPDSFGDWGYDLGNNNGWGNNENEYYTEGNAFTDGLGSMKITAERIPVEDTLVTDSCVSCQFYSARILTKDKVSFKYGHLEARIWMPTGDGTWPAFWLLGDNIDSVNWPTSGEIDVVEQSSDKAVAIGTVHGPGYSGANGLNQRYSTDDLVNLNEGWHTYAIDWKPGSITWLVDGHAYYTQTKSVVQSMGHQWVFDHDFFIIVNMALGGWFVGGIDPGLNTATMKIDYIHYSKYQGYGQVTRH